MVVHHRALEGFMTQIQIPVNEHNQMMLDKNESQLIIVPVIYILRKDCNINIESLKKRKLSETVNIASLLKLKVGAQIMIIRN